jgi:acyl-[acyl-carrier-protein] desaturase
MSGAAPSLRFGTPQQIDVLRTLEPAVVREMDEHIARRRLWFPNDLMPADAELDHAHDAEIAALRERARGLPDAVRVAVALNLLTEEGLPHFHRLIAMHFGQESPWVDWNNLWTAEEDRHGCALRDYVRDARLFTMGPLEKLQYQYIEAGFDPNWEQDPYQLLAYTSLQEKATQFAHANTGRLAGPVEPTLQRVLAHLAGDESRHYQFYRAVFGEILKVDPDRALRSLLKVTVGFSMPGHAIAGFDDMSDVVARKDIFSTSQYREIVVELLAYWNIGGMTGLGPEGAKMQDRLMKMPSRLARMADAQAARHEAKVFSFKFIGGRSVTV